MRLQIKVMQEMNTKSKSNYTTTSDKTYNSLGVHNVCLSAEQNRPAVFLRAVGGPTSKRTLKGEDTWERPWDVYTARKEPGGPTATKECQSGICSSLYNLRLSLWVGKNSSFPLLIIARERRGRQTNDSAE